MQHPAAIGERGRHENLVDGRRRRHRDPGARNRFIGCRKFDGRVIGLNALTTEYAVVFGGEMGFSISSEVDRTLEREGHDRRVAARAAVP